MWGSILGGKMQGVFEVKGGGGGGEVSKFLVDGGTPPHPHVGKKH